MALLTLSTAVIHKSLYNQKNFLFIEVDIVFCSEIDLALLPGSLGEQMSKVWPSLKQSRRSAQSETFSFWRHEWTKHGTCAVKLNQAKGQQEQLFSAEAYFATVLQLYRRFPLSRWLTSARIVPSNDQPYSRAQIHRALEGVGESLRGVFRLKCDRPPSRREEEASSQFPSPAILSEVQICLDQSLKPVHCAHLFAGRRTGGRKYENSQVEAFETFDEKCGNEVILLES